MELSSSDKERIQHQYDALAKKTLVGEAKSHRRTLAKRAAREVTFSDLSESELAQLFTTDEYESDYFRFQVSGFDVLVKNELLAEALNAFPALGAFFQIAPRFLARQGKPEKGGGFFVGHGLCFWHNALKDRTPDDQPMAARPAFLLG